MIYMQYLIMNVTLFFEVSLNKLIFIPYLKWNFTVAEFKLDKLLI